MRTDDPIQTVLEDAKQTGDKAIKAERNFMAQAKYAFEKEYGPYRDRMAQYDAFLAGVKFGSKLVSAAIENEYLGLEARSIETGWRGVIVETYRDGNDEDGYEDMFIMYQDTDDTRHHGAKDVIVYPR
jgi:hypothetical protein